MKISYVSDLHLEFLDYYDFSNDPGGDVLILAGDISTAWLWRPDRTDQDGRSFQKYVKNSFKPKLTDKYDRVFYILGNHEHYRYQFKASAPTIIDALKHYGMDNVTLLDNTSVLYQNKLFVGSTLWTDFEGQNPTVMMTVHKGMNDYRIIADDTGKEAITPEYTLAQHDYSLKYIKHCVSESKNNGMEVIVITHHVPSSKSLSARHVGNGLDGAYYTNLNDYMADLENVPLWFHGHTHQNFDYTVGKVRVLANQRGYNSERSYIDFAGTKQVEL